ncbi:MAG: beta-N-acetylhexosaminidase [Magnetococcales bacterium]|nr:beta-N-acetylhexosaminidase [Magnetococcales bacterium]
MTAQQQPSRHLVLGISSFRLTPEEKAWLGQINPAGIILFGRNIQDLSQVKALIQELQETITPPPTLWIDQEGGRVQRLRDPFTRFPSPYQYTQLFRQSAEAGLEMAQLGGWVCGQELASIGIGVNCAPVLDIQQNRADPVIGNRAFGSTPDEVIQLASAWIAGLKASGIMAVGKHFPGHGAAQCDSHKTLPTIEKSLQEMEEHELLPFKTLAPDLPALMTAHLIAKGLDAAQPATWSAAVLKKLLREQWNYKGLVVSDAVEMGALTGSTADRVYRALLAGCDLVLCCTGNLTDNQNAVNGAIQAVSERDPKEQLDSMERIESLLTPYQKIATHSLDGTKYGKAKQQLEKIADKKTQTDPTQQ